MHQPRGKDLWRGTALCADLSAPVGCKLRETKASLHRLGDARCCSPQLDRQAFETACHTSCHTNKIWNIQNPKPHEASHPVIRTKNKRCNRAYSSAPSGIEPGTPCRLNSISPTHRYPETLRGGFSTDRCLQTKFNQLCRVLAGVRGA